MGRTALGARDYCEPAQLGNLDDVMGWIVTYVEYTGAEPITITACLGSDDGGQLWWDTRLLVNDAGCRGIGDCNAGTATVTVAPGVHRIAAAAWDRGGGWALRLALQDETFFPIIDDPDLSPDWIFHGPNRPDGFEGSCDDVIDPVTIEACERNEDGGIDLAWESPPDAANPIRIFVNGIQFDEVPADATTASLEAEILPDEDPLRICVDNGATAPACCTITGNLALDKPATQSSTCFAFPAEIAVDGDLTNFTHTCGGATSAEWNLGLGPAIWEVDLGDAVEIKRIVLHNRDSCCQSRLRDIIVSVHEISWDLEIPLDPTIEELADAVTPLWEDAIFESDILNEENDLGAQGIGGPETLEIDLSELNVAGRYVRVTRIPDLDLSGTDGVVNTDEFAVLSLGEVQVFGESTAPQCPVDGDLDFEDTVCEGLSVSGPLPVPAGDGAGAAGPGVYEVTATGSDATGDALSYAFSADDGAGTVLSPISQTGATASFDLTVGTWTITATVDDGPCPDNAPGATCSEVVVVTDGDGVPFIRADANTDGSINLSDPVAILNTLFLGIGEIPCDAAADANADGSINLSDPVAILNTLFLGIGEIPPPAACGEELADVADCASFTACQ